MSILQHVKSLDELDPRMVEELQQEFVQLLQEKYPDLDLRGGVLHDIVAFLAGGVSGAINQTVVGKLMKARSLRAIMENADTVDPDLVDHVLSNYFIERRQGKPARGEVVVVVAGDTTVVIPGGTIFRAAGLEFVVESTITAKTPGNTAATDNERIMAPRGDGSFEFAVPVVARVAGAAGNLRADTRFTPSPVPARFLAAYNTRDFSGGTDSESTTALLSRIRNSIPAKVVSGRAHTRALLFNAEQFADSIQDVTVIGAGDQEMLRDRHPLFPVSTGGKVDIYVRTAGFPHTIVLRKTAVLVERTPQGSVWQFSLDKHDAPGFYLVREARRITDPSDITGFPVDWGQRKWNLDDERVRPTLPDVLSAGFNVYQTGVFRFTDSDDYPSDPVGTQRDYDIVVLAMPLLREIQDFLHDDTRRPLSLDLLVKAPLPCWTRVTCRIAKATDDPPVDVEGIRQTLLTTINGTGISGTLYAMQLAESIQPKLVGRQVPASIRIGGRVDLPDGTRIPLQPTDVLEVPESVAQGVSGRTVAFFASPDDIEVTVTVRGH